MDVGSLVVAMDSRPRVLLTFSSGLYELASRMSHHAAVPFTLQRHRDVIAGGEITSTHETVHGLLHLDGERVVIQWRTSRAIDRVGAEIRTDRELEPVRELSLPLSALAGAEVRWAWWRWPPGRYLVLTGADLRAFEELAGNEGLELKHPAQFEIRISKDFRVGAVEFASELKLALADRALRAAEDEQLPDRSTEQRSLERPKNS